MSRAKILSDMASQGVTAAEFDVLDGYPPTGYVIQVVQSLNKYGFSATGVPDTYYTIESSSGNGWYPSIAISSGNKIFTNWSFLLASDADPLFGIRWEYQTGGTGGSWTIVDQGDSDGGRERIFAAGRLRIDGGVSYSPGHISFSYLHDTSGLGAVTMYYRLRIRQGAGSNRRMVINQMVPSDDETVNAVGTCIMQEIKG